MEFVLLDGVSIRTGTLTSPNATAPDQIERIVQFLHAEADPKRG